MDFTRDEISDTPALPSGTPSAPAAPLSYAVAAWLQRVDAAAHPKASLNAVEPDPKATQYRLIYVLAPTSGGRHVALCLYKARLRANGDVAAASPVSEVFSLLSAPPGFMSAGDEDLVRFFVAMRSGQNSQTGSATEPKGKIGAALLQMLSEQGKLLWANSWADVGNGLVYPLQAGPLRQASLIWRDEGKSMRLGWHVAAPEGVKHHGADQIDYMLPTDPPWYIDNLSCGVLNLNQGDAAISLQELQALVAQAPLLTANDKMRVSQLLLAHGLQHLMPLPQPLPQRVRNDVKVQPVLLLDSAQLADGSLLRWNDFAVLSYDYDGERVSFDPSQRVVRQIGAVTEIIGRDAAAEAAALDVLSGLGFLKPSAPPLSVLKGAMLLDSQAAWLRFAEHGIAALQAQGWRVEKSAKYRYDVTEVDDWYADVAEQAPDSGNAWFELELGIVVNQARVPLLPVLVQLIRSAPSDFNPKTIDAHADADQMLATLPDGLRVALPWGRIKPILSTLGELYFSDKIKNAVRMSTLDAARLDELARGTALRWTGGEQLLEMGRKLNQFGSVEKITAPAGLRATLRDYQADGVAWMQFLRTYDLAGILADDMGLGKTVQTLAHILIEKEAGRLTNPALVIAPTSLMGNWQEEAARFAPGLRVLLLQGKDRLASFDQIDQVDLVLTTYALLPRDEEKLREHDFHLVILDESHYIKNTRSKAAQSAGLLRARHRLCLSGTPLENHLGELWSQFHFLLPGLLGDEKAFNSQFRHPIERQDDPLRRTLLNRRIKPFLLRRTKDNVAKELPPKTEMVRKVELTGAQRDLYETVRLAMDHKVRDEIDKKGVARSQIVILEALLKLRQVCCDPRLVKSLSSSKKQAAGSAKLIDLMQMVEDLLEEGRKILVFSQFTSMLELIEDELELRGIPYALLTGDTKDRGAQVAAFQQGAVPIFLISLKAGGVGLNLTAADTVIHYDPWWNPAAENQATDRAWRIGQDKPVFVYKLIAKGTLEEKIQVLQQKKSELAQSILAEGESQKMALTQEDLQQIFAPLAD
jgi:superfamily II DNA or RNA helicase